jgi:hypothetical protein
VDDTTDSGVEIWKGNSTTPTSFSEQDNTNNPQTTDYTACGMAIDSTDVIHIIYCYYNGKTSQLRYVTFDADGTTDTFSGDVALVADLGADPGSLANLYASIVIDALDIPHVTWVEFLTNMGTDYDTVMYTNKVGGSWVTTKEIEGFTVEENCVKPDIAINILSQPVIIYYNETEFNVKIAEADEANDTTMIFTIYAVGSGAFTNSENTIAVDSNGDYLIGYHRLNTTLAVYRKDVNGDVSASGSWSTSDISQNGSHGSIALDGTDIYFFYQDTDTDQRIAYDKHDGSWSGETILETPAGGTDFWRAMCKQSLIVDNDSTGRVSTVSIMDFADYQGTSSIAVYGGFGSEGGAGMSFTGDGGEVNKCAFELDDVGSPTGTMYANLYAHSGTYGTSSVPTGSPLATSSTVAATVIGGANRYWVVFDFPTPYTTTSGTKYCIAIIYESGDSSNHIRLATNPDAPEHGGNVFQLNSGSWAATSGDDGMFYIVSCSFIAKAELDYTYENRNTGDIYWNILSLASGALTISVNDSVALTESITNLITKLFINVNDEVTLTENITNVIKSFINVSDNVILSENIKTTIVNNISVSDEVGLTENVVNLLTSFINVSDNVTLSENITNLVTSFISVSDNVTLTEFVDVLIVLISALSINVIDSVALTESISNRLRSFVNVNDNVTLVENIKNSLRSFINVSDEVTLTENIALTRVNNISVNDTVSLVENVTTRLRSFINVNDDVTLTENIKPVLKSFINVSDSVTLEELVSLTITTISALNINVNDSVALTENINNLVTSFINVSDSVSLTESILNALKSFISTSDSVTLNENVDSRLRSFISVNDTISINEFVNSTLTSFINVNDSVTLTEVVSLVLEVLAGLSINVSDSVSLTENIKTALKSFISTSDNVTLTENIKPAVKSFINVSDTVSLVENVTTRLQSYINVSDSISTEDVIVMHVPIRINVSDTVTLTEDITNLVKAFISVNDNVTVSENIQLSTSAIIINVNDSVALTEAITMASVTVGDIISLTLFITQSKGFELNSKTTSTIDLESRTGNSFDLESLER